MIGISLGEAKATSDKSARSSASQDHVTLQISILRSHLGDAQEPRPTKADKAQRLTWRLFAAAGAFPALSAFSAFK